jgi:5-methylcytosine-specific restriction protein A
VLTPGVCSEVGCPKRATYRGKCAEHAKAERRRRHESTRAWRRLRAEAIARAGGICERCGIRPAVDAHHLVRRSRGGRDRIDNLVALCEDCHAEEHRHG